MPPLPNSRAPRLALRALFTMALLVRTGHAEPALDCSVRADIGYASGKAFVVELLTVDGRRVERATAAAYWAMAVAAEADGVKLVIKSGFRSMAEQEYFYGCYKTCKCNGCALAGKPGFSEHQSGHALDLNWRDPGVFAWLEKNAGRFGFKRTVPSEKWHWEWWGGGPPWVVCGESCTPSCSGSVLTTASCAPVDCAGAGASCGDEGAGPSCVGGSLDGKWDAPPREGPPDDEPPPADATQSGCQLDPRSSGSLWPMTAVVAFGLARRAGERRPRSRGVGSLHQNG